MIYSIEEIGQECQKWKKESKNIVFTNGCFDLLHKGHIDLLKKSLGFGDILIVGLNSDRSIKRLKGSRRPIENERTRVKKLLKLNIISGLCIFDNEIPLELIKVIKPDVLVKGGDYEPNKIIGSSEVIKEGGMIKIVPLLPGYSTTRSIEKMRREGLV
jgi:rfaE bifunctional protein nucleotidyltransferase chain/domain